MKRVLSMVLALIMLLSFNAFALSTTEITKDDAKVVGIGGGIEVVFTKSGNILTAKTYVVGEFNNMNGVNVGLKANNSYLTTTEDDIVLSDEFAALQPDWNLSAKRYYGNVSGYNYAGYHTNAETLNDYISVASGERLLFVTINYTIVDNVEVTSANIGDMISFNAQWRAQSKITVNDKSDITATTDPEVFEFNTAGLDSYNLSINTPANGIATLSETTVAGGKSTDLTVIPAVGYYIESVMAGSSNITSSFDAYRGGTIEYTPTANTAITVTFAEIENVTEDVTTSTGMTGVDALTLPEVFRGKVNNEATEDVSIAFGQVAPNGGKEVAGYGIYLTNFDGSDVTTAAPSIGPKFAAKTISADNQFGIIFEQIKAGSYFAQTYIEYKDGSIVLGIKVPFTVANKEGKEYA